jgi:hypothetical protein
VNAHSPSLPSYPLRWILAATASCAAFLGVLWWINGGFFDSDEAVVGLMARHILFQHEFPVFYWGQEYMGAVEAYLAVPLFAVFGCTVRTLKLVPLGFTVATVPIAAAIAYRAAGRRAAICTAFIFATPPLAFTLWSLKTRGGFTEPVELGLWIFWGTFKIVEAATERRKLIWAAACGFALGVGLWWGEFVVPFTLGALLVLVIHPRARTVAVWATGTLGTLVGAGPAIWRNAFTTHWATVTHALVPDPLQASVQHQPLHAVPEVAWHNLHTIGVPAMLGLHDARIAPFDWHGPQETISAVLVGLAMGGALGAVCLLLLAKMRLESRLATAGPLIGGAAMILLYVYSRFGFEREPRYVLALWPAFAFCFGWIAWAAARLRWFLGAMVCAGLMGFQVQRVYFSEPLDKVALWNPGAPITRTFVPLTDKLLAMGKTHILADYWTALRISFDSRERVIALDPGGDRQPGAKERVLNDPHTCWLSTRGNQADQAVREQGWQRTEFGTDVEGLGEPQVLACPP